MEIEEKRNKINKELKVYINESSFISNKCRNKLLKIFSEEFSVDLDIDNYQNVDLSINEDNTFTYREDIYKSKEKIKSFEEIEKRYEIFKEKADKLIKRKDINFDGKRNLNNITNLIVVICILLFYLIIILLSIHAFITGKYIDCFWLVFIIVPRLFPNLRENLDNRFQQAKIYFKTRKKKK